MSKVVTTTVLPDVAGGSVTFGGTGDSVVATGNDIRTNALQDAGGNAVFTSNGSGVMSGMNSAFAGALKLLSTQTASNQASVSFTTGIDSTYDVYMFKFFDIHAHHADDGKFSFQVNAVGQSGYNETITSTYFLAQHSEADATDLQYTASADQAQGTGIQRLMQSMGSAADESGAGTLYLFAPSGTTYVKHWYSRCNNYNSGDKSEDCFAGGYINTTSAIDEIQFSMSADNLTGTIKMYGISKS